MGIRVDFLIKHVRPYGIDAWNELCADNGELANWLRNAGVSDQQINIAFNAWALTANLPVVPDAYPAFVESAQLISRARWSQLYDTPLSTVLYLTLPLIRELSFTSENEAGRRFQFNPAEYIPIAVTIRQQDRRATVGVEVEGANLAADNNGDCVHYAGLI